MPLTWIAECPSWVLFADSEDIEDGDEAEKYMSKAQAAQYLSVSVTYLNRLVRNGRIAVDHYENDEAGGYKQAYFAREGLDRHQAGR